MGFPNGGLQGIVSGEMNKKTNGSKLTKLNVLRILTPDEQSLRTKLIETAKDRLSRANEHMGQFFEVIQELQAKKLYLSTHKNFNEFCVVTFGMTLRNARYLIQQVRTEVIVERVKKSNPDAERVKEGARNTEFTFRAKHKLLTNSEFRAIGALPEKVQEAKITELLDTPKPPRGRMPPPLATAAVEANGHAAEPTVKKPTCPIDNEQLAWVIAEIETYYVTNKAALNCIPPITPMMLVSKIQHHLNRWKVG